MGPGEVLCPFNTLSHLIFQTVLQGVSFSKIKEQRLPQFILNWLQVSEAWQLPKGFLLTPYPAGLEGWTRMGLGSSCGRACAGPQCFSENDAGWPLVSGTPLWHQVHVAHHSPQRGPGRMPVVSLITGKRSSLLLVGLFKSYHSFNAHLKPLPLHRTTSSISVSPTELLE